MTPPQLLAAAERLLERPGKAAADAWTRAAALLARQALEQSLDSYWRSRGLAMTRLATGPQLICLADYLDDRSLGESVRHAWGALSDACHHPAYELAPSASELRGWIATVRELVQRTHAPADRGVR